MVTKEQLTELLQDVMDPQYQQSVVLLNFIKDVMIKEDGISLTYVTTVEDEDYKKWAQAQVTAAVEKLGTSLSRIRFRAITDYERSQLDQYAGGPPKVSNDEKKQKPQTEPSKSSSALLSPDSKVEFIAVASGKGGVGKSTVTVNLAVALARLGKKVGIIDADIYGFSVPDMMGIDGQPAMEDNRIIPVEKQGVKVISMGFFVQDNAPIIWRGPMLGKMLKNFFNEVNWGELDYLLLDLPPGTGDVALDVHQMLPGSKEIIVTTPHATAAFVAARAGAMAVSTNHEILGVVENMSYYECQHCGKPEYIFGRGGGGKLAEELHTELLAQIPLGVPDNHISEPDFSPSIYKESSRTGLLYIDLAKKIIRKTNG
jgi:ATP-binding protein involved in chromosome partitioning